MPHLASADEQCASLSRGAVRSLLASHATHSKLAVEAVQLVADLVRQSK